jgi:hypothetical protein
MLNVDPVGLYRVEDVSPTDGVVAGTAGMGAGTVGRYRAGDAHPTDLEGEIAAHRCEFFEARHPLRLPLVGRGNAPSPDSKFTEA